MNHLKQLPILGTFWCIISCVYCISYNNGISAISVVGSYPGSNSFTINSTTEYIISYSTYASVYPTRLTTVTTGANMTFPIRVVVRQQKGVFSWQLPLRVNSKLGPLSFYTTSRTLCHTHMDIIAKLNRSSIDFLSQLNQTTLRQTFSISVSTSSSSALDVDIITQEATDFYIKENQEYSIVISPSEPIYYYYKFSEPHTDNYSDTVVLEVNSEDQTCFYVSLQDPSCPIYDLENDVGNAKIYQTVNTKGGLTVGNFEFPNGFFIVFVAKGDNYDCSIENSLTSETERLMTFSQTSKVNFKVRSSISIQDYIKAALIMLGAILIFYVVLVALLCTFFQIGRIRRKSSLSSDVTARYLENFQSPMMRTLEIDISRESLDDHLNRSTLYLCDLAKRSSDYYEKKSLNYCWQVLIIAIFYGIPVVQLVITYQRILNYSGNQDMCYYNFLCANPLFGMSDFNHIFSNVGYIFVGILFLLLVYIKDKWEIEKPSHGIPLQSGMFYAMGIAVIIEGILSACYHICPNQANFQFDTSFMYVLAVLVIIKIYQKRHPDINAVAYATFLVLGIAIFMATIGIVDGSLSIWILFIVSYIMFCVYLSFNTYFLSYVKHGLMSVFKDCTKRKNELFKVFKPRRRAHFIVCLLGNIINSAMALMGIYCYLNGIDFGSFLLAILLGNATLYSISYTCMKLIHGERICAQAICFGILTLLSWGFSAYFFTRASTLWYVSPAESRQRNTNCQFLNFYDEHDIWHFLSAASLLFTFVFLMVVDDDLKHKPHFEIPVF